MKKQRGIWMAAAVALLAAGSLAGCGLFQAPATMVAPSLIAPSTAESPAQQIASSLDAVSELLAEIRAERSVPAAPAAVPVSVAPPAVTAPAPAIAPTPVTPAVVAAPVSDKESQALALLTSALQQLNSTMQSAPTAQAQQQAAFATGIQTAQSAAVTFGGQYGALIAAGLGIVGVLIQGMTNTSKAHQTAQAANATAQALAGKLPPAVH